MSSAKLASPNTATHGSSYAYIPATKILHKVVKELGGTEPIYENVSWHGSQMEHHASFKILAKGPSETMVDIAICGLSDEVNREGNVYDNIARDALQLLQDEYGINVLDYSWLLAEELRWRCIPMVKNLIESEKIYEFVHTKCVMVLDGIDFASNLFMNKVYEIENELKKGHVHVNNMAIVLRACAWDLKNIGQSSTQELRSDYGFHTMLQKGMRSRFNKPYADYINLKHKVGTVNINSGLKIILDQVASKAGFQLPVLTVDHVIGSGYIGNVQLNPSECASIPNGITCNNVQGKLVSEQFEAANSAMYHDTYGLSILDPSFYVLSDLEKVEDAIKRELHVLAQRSSAVERIAHCAINDIHNLADRYDGSISEKDAEIKGVLISMCIDLARHLDAVYQLINAAWKNCRV